MILGFLIGAVISWGLRVWALIPITFLILTTTVAFDLWQGERVLPAVGQGFVVAFAPQLGYAFGLLVRSVLAGLRSPRKAAPARSAAQDRLSGV
jgi:hypothetical protein